MILLSRFCFAARVGAWLCALPIRVRLRPLPALLRKPASGRQARSRKPAELDEAVRIVARVCRMRLFDLPVFPRRCLRRSLALQSVLTRMGCEVEIHFGVRKEGPDLHGHSWVTVDGVPIAEKSPAEAFRTIFSYRSPSTDASLRPVHAFPSG